MKKFIFIVTCLFLLSGCDDLKDIWIVYQFRPHHEFKIDNKSQKKICQNVFQSRHYLYFQQFDHFSWPDELLKRILYIDENSGEVILQINNENTSLYTGFMSTRYEDLDPIMGGYICFLSICYVEDLYAVYNKEKETVPFWLYSYTLDDLKRYNWVVPFPDESGTIKIEKFEYRIKEGE